MGSDIEKIVSTAAKQYIGENDKKKAPSSQGGTGGGTSAASSPAGKQRTAEKRRKMTQEYGANESGSPIYPELYEMVSPAFFNQMLGETKYNWDPQKGYGGNETGNFAYPELHEFVSPAFFYQMTKDARDNRNLGKANETGNFPELEELVSPEFFNQMLDKPTKNRDQKKRDLWDYNQGYHTQTDQVIYGLDMYEISRMTDQERSALEAYMWAKNGTAVDGTGAVVDDLPQKKQDVLNLLGGRYDIRRIDELAETYGRSLEVKAIQAARERGEQRGKGDAFTKFWSSALTVPASLGGDLVSPLYRLNELASSTGRYSGFAPNSLGGILDVYSQSVRNAVEEDIRGDGENGWRNMAALGYRGGMGALDMAARIALYGDYANIFSGIGAFGDRITDASSKDASYGEALTLAGADALITAVLKKIPMDQLLGTARSDPKGFFGMLGDAVKAVGAQVGTGGLDYFANMAVEQGVLQDRSGYSRALDLKMQDGTSYEDATRAVNTEIWKQVLEGSFVNAISGLASSYMMSGYSHGKRAYENWKAGRQEAQDDLNGEIPQIGAVGVDEMELSDDSTSMNTWETDAPLTGEQVPNSEVSDQPMDNVFNEAGNGVSPEEARVHSQELQQEFMEFKEVLGENAPETLEDFENLKYNDPDRWQRMTEFREYMERVPEASDDDFQKYLKVKAIGEQGIIRIPPERIDVSGLTFRDAHAAHYGCTVEEAREYVKNAYCTIYKERWDGVSANYFSADGAAYIDIDTMQIKTSFPRKKYDSHTKAIVEEFE